MTKYIQTFNGDLVETFPHHDLFINFMSSTISDYSSLLLGSTVSVVSVSLNTLKDFLLLFEYYVSFPSSRKVHLFGGFVSMSRFVLTPQTPVPCLI